MVFVVVLVYLCGVIVLLFGFRAVDCDLGLLL